MRWCVAALWLWALMLTTLAAAAPAHQDAPAQSDNDVELTEEEKRAWSSLHGGGGWGKRGWQDLNSAWGKRAWQDLNSAWGKRAWQDLNSAWGKRGWQDLNSAWGKRGWQDLNSAWGKRAWSDMNQPWGKRGWQDLNSAWGKRGWQDMSSAWGKRAPEKWANFHGSWGKRSGPENDYEDFESLEQLVPVHQMEGGERMVLDSPDKKAWSELHGAWGKRPVKQMQLNSGTWTTNPFLAHFTTSVLSNAECSRTWTTFVTDFILCTGAGADNANICSGDSGGPVTVGNVLVGLVSYGNGAGRGCEEGLPAGHSRVSAYHDWITARL